jgi:hypothetical protein
MKKLKSTLLTALSLVAVSLIVSNVSATQMSSSELQVVQTDSIVFGTIESTQNWVNYILNETAPVQGPEEGMIACITEAKLCAGTRCAATYNKCLRGTSSDCNCIDITK